MGAEDTHDEAEDDDADDNHHTAAAGDVPVAFGGDLESGT